MDSFPGSKKASAYFRPDSSTTLFLRAVTPDPGLLLIGAVMNGHTVVACFLASLLIVCTRGGNILVVPVDGSHWINMKFLVEALHSKGHNITVIRAANSWYIEESSPFYTSITIQSTGMFDEEFMGGYINKLLKIRREGSIFPRLKLEKELWEKKIDMFENEKKVLLRVVEDKLLVKSLKDTKYDVCLTDPALISGVIIGHFLKLPLVFNVRWTVHGEGHFATAPSPLSYIPVPMMEFSDRMSFFQRVKNVLMYLIIQLQIKYYLNSMYNALCDRVFGPGVNYYEIVQGADLWLYRSDFIFEFPRPTMPNIVYMSAFQCKPSKSLPQDLEDFVQSSGEHGVIIMSLGTLIEQLPRDVADAVAEAFAELPQKVIWRYKGERPSTLGNNTLLVDWMPQNDLLGHPKTRAFVAHGGTNGVQEAIYHGVPLVGFGLIWDQPDNLSKMKVRGAAKMVDIATLDKNSFLQTVKEVLHDPSYRENMQRLSRLHKDVPVKPLDNAVFWIEHVMRHGGAPHLRTESYKMPWYSYHSVDVLLFLLSVVSLIVFITYRVIRYCCCRLCMRRKTTKRE
ncbi:UDP-glucuronosyltransferase 2C1-like isoform X1 [Astyanax mexicanus]|uniref:UDP-glucuronosyltransferase 2C1-like isoform X1 n=1 Tax=Astyanax mexicanus TaxID=7994 RepID=A0A8T2KW80_ASTMX|nr:UDP-glucuronosyltransferase 2C1-like isoform X1 [Astyanax mexicanus]